MPIILNIGYNHFLIQKDSDAAKILSAIAGAVQLDDEWHKDRRVYFPHENQIEISMTLATEKNFLRCKPGEEVDGGGFPIKKLKQLNPGKI